MYLVKQLTLKTITKGIMTDKTKENATWPTGKKHSFCKEYQVE